MIFTKRLCVPCGLPGAQKPRVRHGTVPHFFRVFRYTGRQDGKKLHMRFYGKGKIAGSHVLPRKHGRYAFPKMREVACRKTREVCFPENAGGMLSRKCRRYAFPKMRETMLSKNDGKQFSEKSAGAYYLKENAGTRKAQKKRRKNLSVALFLVLTAVPALFPGVPALFYTRAPGALTECFLSGANIPVRERVRHEQKNRTSLCPAPFPVVP